MAKIRKQRIRKQYNYKTNRKRLNKKRKNVGKINCDEIRKAWEQKKSVGVNLKNMGLANDPNKVLKIPSAKQERIKLAKLAHGKIRNINIVEKKKKTKQASKQHVAKELEQNANALREIGFRFPKSQVELISYYMDTHKLNYRAMARDKKNYEQETLKQIRTKVRRFISIPEHFDLYLRQRNLESFDAQEEGDVSD